MFEYIKGKLVIKKPTSIIVEAGGIGFNINITLPAFEHLPSVGEEVKVITHFHIKDAPFSILIYGFTDEEERSVFRHIISISGVGPKTAMSILSAVDYRQVIELISKGDYIPLTTVSGVGRKTAERIAMELKDKLGRSEAEITYSKLGAETTGEPGKISGVISALMTLGYNRIEADKMVKKIASSPAFSQLSVEELIKEILRGEG